MPTLQQGSNAVLFFSRFTRSQAVSHNVGRVRGDVLLSNAYILSRQTACNLWLRQIFAYAIGSEYYCGHWRAAMPLSLLWTSQPADGAESKKSDIYRAPTWSWAALECPIKARPQLASAKVVISVLSVGVHNKTSDLFRLIDERNENPIHLTGHALQLNWNRNADNWSLSAKSHLSAPLLRASRDALLLTRSSPGAHPGLAPRTKSGYHAEVRITW
jgi:hypothetical protein